MPDVKIRAVQVALPTSGAPVDVNFDVTDFGNPKAAMFIVSHGVTNGTLNNQARLGYGITDGTRHRCWGGRARDNRNSSSTRQNRHNDRVIYLAGNTATTIDVEASWSQWNTNGVRISVTNVPGQAVACTCVLFGGADLEAYVGDIVTSASISGTATSANIGFELDQLIMGTADRFATNFSARNVVDREILMGFADFNDGTSTITQGGWSTTCTDGQAQIHHGAVSSDTYVIRNITDNGAGTNTLGAGYELTAVGSTDFTLTTRLTAEANDIAFLALRFGGLEHWMGRQNTANASPPITQNIETPGFPPLNVLALIGGQTGGTLDTSVTSDNAGVMGMGTFNESEEFVVANVGEDNITRSNEQSYTDTYAVWNRNHGTGAECSANLDEFDSLGWNATFDQTRASTIQTWYLTAEKPPILVQGDEVVNIGDEGLVQVTGPAGTIIVTSETVNILEDLQLRRAIALLLNETVNITDALAISRAIALVTGETVNILEALQLHRGITLVTDEVVNITDQTQLRRAIALILNETVHILDAEQVQMELLLVVGETVNILDETIFNRAISLVTAETVNIVEDLQLSRAIALVTGETVNIVEALRLRRAISLVTDETVHILDGVQVLVLGAQTIIVVDETVNVLDALQVQKEIKMVLGETVHIVEDLQIRRAISLVVDEIVHLVEQLQLRRATVVITNETVEISDAVQVQRDITLVLQETVQIQDQVVVLPGIIVIANETVDITDQLITKLTGSARIVVSFRGRIIGATPVAGRVLSSSPEQGRLRP